MTKTINTAKACFAIALAIMLTACASSMGRKFDETYAQQIKSGETTKTEVLSKLGRPVFRRGPADEESWIYAYYDRPMFYWPDTTSEDFQYGLGRQTRLVVEFRGDVVKSSTFTLEIPQR